MLHDWDGVATPMFSMALSAELSSGPYACSWAPAYSSYGSMIVGNTSGSQPACDLIDMQEGTSKKLIHPPDWHDWHWCPIM